MSSSAQHAEVQKLARLLKVPREHLAFVEKLEPAMIRTLREQATASLFDADRYLFQRVASASRLLPPKITALIAEKALGPLLCARIAGLMAIDRAVDVSRRLPAPYLAEVSMELDPRQVRELIAALPAAQITDVALELARRGEFITMARFVDCLPDASMRSVLQALTDNIALIRIGAYVENPCQLGNVIAELSDDRLHHLIRAAIDASDASLWGDALAIIVQIDADQRARMSQAACALEADALNQLIRRTQACNAWPDLLAMLPSMDADDVARIAALEAWRDDETLSGLIVAADQADQWAAVYPVLQAMPAAVQLQAARVAERMEPELAQRISSAIGAAARSAKRAG